MSEVKIIPTEAQLLEASRANVRQLLTGNRHFQTMNLSEQKDLYVSLVQEDLNKQKKAYGLMAGAMATDSGKDMGYKGYDPDFRGDTRDFNDLVKTVNFPKFVSDLLKAVFDANLDVMAKQTKSYIALMKEATKSTADFIKKVKDDDTFGKLIEKHQDKYNITRENTENADGSRSDKMVLVNADNEKVDIADDEVRKHILDAKIEMAKEHRAALREVLLMGVTRLVVEKGEIDAAVEFTIKGKRKSGAHHDDMTNTTTTDSGGGGIGGGFLGGLIGGLDIGGSHESTETSIEVNTSDKATSDEMTGKLSGHVNIKFKTDYFKLDNFANMYADGGVAALKPAAAGAPGGQPQIAAPTR